MRIPWIVAAAVAGVLASDAATASTIFQRLYQAETRDPYGRITREEANIYVLLCNGYGESGRPYYIYQYLRRSGFRVIAPPNWSTVIGGREWATWAQAVSAASCARQANPQYPDYWNRPVPLPQQVPQYWPQPVPNPQQYPQYPPPSMPRSAPTPAPPPAAVPQSGGLTGRWTALGTTYEMVQTGNTFTWSAFNGAEIGRGTIDPDGFRKPEGLHVDWGAASGGGTTHANGTVQEFSGGVPSKIRWSNGIDFNRVN